MLGDFYDHELEPCMTPLATLTNLKELRLLSIYEETDMDQVWTGWYFLSALTGLTCLEITIYQDCEISSSDLLVLTVLTGLQELKLDTFYMSDPSFEAGRPLPLELAFLGTATALEKLDIVMDANCVSLLSAPAYEAVQKALHRL